MPGLGPGSCTPRVRLPSETQTNTPKVCKLWITDISTCAGAFFCTRLLDFPLKGTLPIGRKAPKSGGIVLSPLPGRAVPLRNLWEVGYKECLGSDVHLCRLAARQMLCTPLPKDVPGIPHSNFGSLDFTPLGPVSCLSEHLTNKKMPPLRFAPPATCFER